MALSPKQTAALKTYLRAFIAASFAVAFTQMQSGSYDWTAILTAGVTAILGPVIKWLDPTETTYGRGSE